MTYIYSTPKFSVKRVLSGIKHISPRLHRTAFSGDYFLDELSKIGKFFYDDTYSQNPDKYSDKYTKRAYMQLIEGQFAFYFGAESHMPKCCIQIPDTNFELLQVIQSEMPSLKLSSAEYCIDIFCKNPDAVSDLFYLMNRYLYFPYAKEINRAGGDFDGWDEPKGENSVYKVQYAAPQRRFTIYERGPDNKKQKNRWDHAFVDRVRLEANLIRPTSALKKRGPKDITHLIENPRSARIYFPEKPERSLFKFANFKNMRSKINLPTDDMDFTAVDKYGSQETFMSELFKLKRDGVKNLSAYIEETPALYPLKKRIIAALKDFDENWGV